MVIYLKSGLEKEKESAGILSSKRIFLSYRSHIYYEIGVTDATFLSVEHIYFVHRPK